MLGDGTGEAIGKVSMGRVECKEGQSLGYMSPAEYERAG